MSTRVTYAITENANNTIHPDILNSWLFSSNLGRCTKPDGSNRNWAQWQWFSPAGRSADTNIVIGENEDSIQLSAYSLSAVCTNNLNLDGTIKFADKVATNTLLTSIVVSSPGINISNNATDMEGTITYNYPNSNSRFYNQNGGDNPFNPKELSNRFTLSGLSAIPADGVPRTITVSGLAYVIHWDKGGSFPCVEQFDTHIARNLSDWGSCTPFPMSWSFTVTKFPPQDRSPVGVLDGANCDSIIGWTFDPDNSGASNEVYVYMDGRGYNAGPTNEYRGDVNAVYGINGNHGFSLSTPAIASAIGVNLYDGGQHTVEVYGINIGPSAPRWGPAVATIGPCTPPDRPPDGELYDTIPRGGDESTCDTLRGVASDLDSPRNIDVDIYRDGNFETRVPTSGGSWSYGISQYKDFAGHTFEAFALGVDRNGNNNGVNPSIGKIIVGPCAVPQCQAVTYSVDSVEAGSLFTLSASLRTDIGVAIPPQPFTARLELSGLGVNISSLNPVTGSTVQGVGTISAQWQVTIDSPGYYRGATVFSMGSSSTRCSFGGNPSPCIPGTPGCPGPCIPGTPGCPGPCIPASDCISAYVKPYFKVYGGNVVAGVNETTCEIGSVDTLNSPGRILAFSNGNGNGAGTQLIAQALSIIDGFSSAQGPAINNTNPDKGLSLSNVTTPPNGTDAYGGGFGAANCPDIPTQGQTATTFDNSAGLTTVPVATKQVIYATRDVTISNNITYGGGPWNGIEQIPSFTLVVTGGNIYIDNDVTVLHGLFVAKPSGSTGGNIYTCTEGDRQYTPSELSSGSNDQNNLPCSKPLTVYGSFMAKQVKLLRTNGKTINANNSDTWVTPLPAEKFIYTPELWIRPNGAGTTSEKGKLDSLKPLPPVL